MNAFVEECRREWRRLGVPEAVAAEMAADLEADLAEAEAEGVSAEEVLGSGAFDPRSFAAAWATERGFAGRPRRSRQSSRIPIAIAALAIVAIVGAVLTIDASSSSDVESRFPARASAARTIIALPDPTPAGRPHWFAVDASESNDLAGTVGSVVLIGSLAGIVLVTATWFWLGRRPRGDDRSGGPAY